MLLISLSRAEPSNRPYGFNFSDIQFDTEELSRDVFPKGFTFGIATSAYQVERMADKDGVGQTIWDPYVKIPGFVTCLSIHRYNVCTKMI